ncbi:MAG: TIGR00730 family Rossman fold protein [Alphaproteobacteria bacterium]|nr:TIGR00730 family Rossman fold protein [Alphaproteobacteria bacterium]
MSQIKTVVVFCGGSTGKKEIFMKEAFAVGKTLAENNIRLIYGAGGQGMMRAVAEGALSEDGYVIGTTIQSLFGIERPDLATKVSKMEIFQTMYERKVSMTKQADAAVVLPGGLGTMDELFELVVLRQLGISKQPIIVLNTDGYYNTLRQWLFEMTGMGFAKPHQLKLIHFVDTVEEIVPALRFQKKLIEQEPQKDA